MLRIGALLFALLLLGCEQRTDFDACVEYYTDRVNKDKSIPLIRKRIETEGYIDFFCKLT